MGSGKTDELDNKTGTDTTSAYANAAGSNDRQCDDHAAEQGEGHLGRSFDDVAWQVADRDGDRTHERPDQAQVGAGHEAPVGADPAGHRRP